MTVYHILVPIDFSTYAEQALDYALAFAQKLPGSIGFRGWPSLCID